MNFKSDSQRKAIFAQLNGLNKFAATPYSYSDRVNAVGFSEKPVRLIESDKGVGFVKDEEMMKNAKNYNPPGKKEYDIGTSGKSMKEQMDEFIEKNKRGVSLGQYAKDEFSKKKIEAGSDLQKFATSPYSISDNMTSNYGGFARKPMQSNKMSAGRVPKIEEIVLVPGDESVGIFPFTGHVVKVYQNSADIEVVGGDGRREVVELPFEEFEDQTSIEARRKAENDLYKQWLIEKAEENANRAMGLQ